MMASELAEKPHECAETRPSAALTKNERLVLSVLSRQPGPMKAYELLAALKDDGVKAPMTVYRALDRLEAKGMIHKLDALNSFVLCKHQAPHKVQIFVMCAACGKADEIDHPNLESLSWHEMERISSMAGMDASSVHVEIRGTCKECA